MPTDYYLEQLPVGGDLQPADIMHIQRQVNGVWTDFQILHGNVRGAGLTVLDVTITDAEFTADTFVLLTLAAGKGIVIIDPPIGWVMNPSPTGLTEGLTISAGVTSSDGQAGFTNDAAEQVLVFNSRNYDTISGPDVVLQRTATLAGSDIRIRMTYVLVDI